MTSALGIVDPFSFLNKEDLHQLYKEKDTAVNMYVFFLLLNCKFSSLSSLFPMLVIFSRFVVENLP